MSVGDGYTCGVTPENRAYCWGDNSWGQLGLGTKTGSFRPVAVPGTRRFRQVTAATFHTCGVTPFNKPFCWGNNNWGQLGDGTTTDRLSPVRVNAGGRDFTQLTAGQSHTCGIATNAQAYCWGINDQGQLGDRTKTGRLTPVAVFGGLSFRNLSAGQRHTCGVTTSSRGYCWGNNQQGQVGDGSDYLRRLRPTPVTGGLQFKSASAGANQTCALTTGDRAYCWGALAEPWATPTEVSGSHRFAQLDMGGHACAVTFAGEAYCWGDFFGNSVGQQGNGTTTANSAPTKVVDPA
jgi:alpha-tubulin suppressor-like RCC1 family protein